MTSWFGFTVLWLLLGNPLAALAIIVGLWILADWHTVGMFRRLYRRFTDWRRGVRLQRILDLNPHDRKSRTDLGEILIGQRRHARAIEVLRPVVDADPDDTTALFLLGVACAASGKSEQGELFLRTVLEADDKFGRGAPLLEIGRYRLARGDAAGALEPLGQYLERHPASVEAHYLAFRAQARVGNTTEAQKHRERVWSEYCSSPSFLQRSERLWAWRARPSRPAIYGALLLAAIAGLGWASAGLPEWSERQLMEYYSMPDEDFE